MTGMTAEKALEVLDEARRHAEERGNVNRSDNLGEARAFFAAMVERDKRASDEVVERVAGAIAVATGNGRLNQQPESEQRDIRLMARVALNLETTA